MTARPSKILQGRGRKAGLTVHSIWHSVAATTWRNEYRQWVDHTFNVLPDEDLDQAELITSESPTKTTQANVTRRRENATPRIITTYERMEPIDIM